MVKGLKTSRVHHYLSDLEYACHLLAEYNPAVTDIREQFALLPWGETQEIADSLGIRHSFFPGTSTPIVMTSDLVLTLGQKSTQSYAVICVKPSSSIEQKSPKSRRTMEKLLIEKTYWEKRGIPWHLATEKDIPMTKVRNLDMLRGAMVAQEIDWVNSYMENFLPEFNVAWLADHSLLCILDRVGGKFGLSRNNCFALFARAVWLRLLPINLDDEVIHHDQPLPMFKTQGGDRC